jgi:hypothetical protein
MPPTKKGCTIWVIAAGVVLLCTGPCLAIDQSDAPETVTIDILAELYGPVEFNHAGHTEMVECSDCHHHTVGTVTQRWNCKKCHNNPLEGDTVSCSDCHPQDRFSSKYLATLDDPELFHIEKPGLKGAFHLNCVGCHQEMGGPTGCEECHTMSETGEKRFNTGRYTPAR